MTSISPQLTPEALLRAAVDALLEQSPSALPPPRVTSSACTR